MRWITVFNLKMIICVVLPYTIYLSHDRVKQIVDYSVSLTMRMRHLLGCGKHNRFVNVCLPRTVHGETPAPQSCYCKPCAGL